MKNKFFETKFAYQQVCCKLLFLTEMLCNEFQQQIIDCEWNQFEAIHI